MTKKTKAVNLTEDEIQQAIFEHGRNLEFDLDWHVERINYLNKRLNAFKEPETEVNSDSSAASANDGWPTNG